MTKVMHLFGKLDKGGAELRTIQSLKYYDDNLKFVFVSLSGKKGSLDQDVREMGHDVLYLKFKSLAFPFKLIRIIKSEKVDIVHSHIFYSSAIIIFITKIFTKSKAISHFRTSGRGSVGKLKEIRNNIFKVIINKLSDKILFVSKSTQVKAFADVNKFKSAIIYNGFDYKENLNLNRFQIAHVGRFNEAKNQLFLTDVAKGLNKKDIITFIGNNDTPYGEEFKKEVSERDIENINLIGISNNVDELLQQTKLFLFPSVHEGLPGALIEAALNNCLIIASDIPENKEVASFFPDQIQLLPLDNQTWINEIEKILSKDIVSSFNHSNSFSYDTYISKTEEIYKKLVLGE